MEENLEKWKNVPRPTPVLLPMVLEEYLALVSARKEQGGKRGNCESLKICLSLPNRMFETPVRFVLKSFHLDVFKSTKRKDVGFSYTLNTYTEASF